MSVFWCILYHNVHEFLVYLIFSCVNRNGPYTQVLTSYTFQHFNSAHTFGCLLYLMLVLTAQSIVCSFRSVCYVVEVNESAFLYFSHFIHWNQVLKIAGICMRSKNHFIHWGPSLCSTYRGVALIFPDLHCGLPMQIEKQSWKMEDNL